jgi:hypothetical protein
MDRPQGVSVEVHEMFAKLVSWVKGAVLQAVVDEIREEFAAGGHPIEPPEQLLLAADPPPAKTGRKRKA